MLKKSLKTCVALVLALALLLGVSLPTYASTPSPENEHLSSLADYIEENGIDASVSELRPNEENAIWKKIELRLAANDMLSMFKGHGIHEIDKPGVRHYKVTANNDPNLNVYYFLKTFQNKNGEEFFAMFVYEEGANRLVSVVANTINSDGTLTEKCNFSEPTFTRASVNSNSLLCSLSLGFASIVYCGGIAIGFPIAGLVCEVILLVVASTVCSLQ